MKRHFVIPLIVVLASAGLLFAQKTVQKVAVVAPSPRNYQAARDIIVRSSWIEVPFESADAVLVVVNSDRRNPLSQHYQKFISLKSEAETLPKITSDQWHVYVYDIQPDSSLSERNHNVSVGSF